MVPSSLRARTRHRPRPPAFAICNSRVNATSAASRSRVRAHRPITSRASHATSCMPAASDTATARLASRSAVSARSGRSDSRKARASGSQVSAPGRPRTCARPRRGSRASACGARADGPERRSHARGHRQSLWFGRDSLHRRCCRRSRDFCRGTGFGRAPAWLLKMGSTRGTEHRPAGGNWLSALRDWCHE